MNTKHKYANPFRIALRFVRSQIKRVVNRIARKADLNKTRQWLEGFDKDHVWAFNSGNIGEDFRGNPKYLFVYINNYRPDIRAYWITQNKQTVKQVRALGFHAYFDKEPAAAYAIKRTGVAVAEQVKENFPFTADVKYLNLWHGNGFKSVERARIEDSDDLRINLAKKYILNHAKYANQMILCCVNSLQDYYLTGYIGVEENQVLRTGYLRCEYQQNYKPIVSYDHDILSRQGLPPDTRIAVYAPTYRTSQGRAFSQGNSFLEAIPDLESLYRCCERNHIFLIFKMHPLMEKEKGFLQAAEQYRRYPYFMFWNNRDDIYEIIHKIDLLIYDYSSIFSDFLLGGVKHYIRYIYDSDNMLEVAAINSEEDYYDYTLGTICRSEEDLLAVLDCPGDEEDPAEYDRILHRLWEYASDDDFEKTIRFTMDFKVGHREYPTLYSFDVFDTVLTRKGLHPTSVFCAVRDQLRGSELFDSGFSERFITVRQSAEANVRFYKRKYQEQRNTFHTEITLQEIYERIQEVYALTDEQVEQLISWEIEAELSSVMPLPEQIDVIKKLVSNGETVVLISDMYLPKSVVSQMLKNADPFLATLPLFLSNEYGVLKSNSLLYFDVYRSFKPFYSFGKWIHTGDNPQSDQTMARKLNICTRLVTKPSLTEVESEIVSALDSYDGYLIAAMQSRMLQDHPSAMARFIIDYIAPLMVSYVDWVLRDAVEQGFETLYFVSRDGHPLKRIADALIEVYRYPIKTKYIYASRRVWRIPSYIDEIDPDFWSDYGGNFINIRSTEKFLHAAAVKDEEEFQQLCPGVDLSSIDFSNWSHGQPAMELANSMRYNEQYRSYLLSYAEEQRELVCGYLRQEVDPSEKHAFVEFWGRGYNQLCHSRLWNHTVGKEMPLHYYYVRSAEFTQGNCIRHNMTTNNRDLFFMESVFANMPYRSVEEYEIRDGRIGPVIEPIPYDEELFSSMETLLPEYARGYASLGLKNPSWIDRRLFDFLLDYFYLNQSTPFLYENFGHLKDAVSMYGTKQEFAPPFTEEDIQDFANKVPRGKKTLSIRMSYARSPQNVKNQYDELFQLMPGDNESGGTPLKKKELRQNRRFRRALEKEQSHAERINMAYTEACDKTLVEDLITLVFVEAETDVFRPIIRELEKQTSFAVETIYLKKGIRTGSLVKQLARSKYVLTDRCVPQLSKIVFRPETTSIIVGSTAFSFFAKGTKKKYKLVWERQYHHYMASAAPAAFEASSEFWKKELWSSILTNSQLAQALKGCSATDNYFDQEFVSSAREKIARVFPEARDKKLLLYMPTFRKESPRRYNWLNLIDLTRLKSLIGDEYAVLIDATNRFCLIRYFNELNISGFSKSVSRGMTTREMISCADIIVGDYNEALFECAMLDKPVYSTAADYEIQMKQYAFTCDFELVNPYPIIHTSEELASMISDMEHYDFQPLRTFRQKYLTYCDGHSAERLVAWMLPTAASSDRDDA